MLQSRDGSSQRAQRLKLGWKTLLCAMLFVLCFVLGWLAGTRERPDHGKLQHVITAPSLPPTLKQSSLSPPPPSPTADHLRPPSPTAAFQDQLVSEILAFNHVFDNVTGSGQISWYIHEPHRCFSPYFRVRLSGSALVATTPPARTESNSPIFFANYVLPIHGTYWIELIFLWCNTDPEFPLYNCIERDPVTGFAPTIGPLITSGHGGLVISPFVWSEPAGNSNAPTDKASRARGWLRPANAVHEATPVRWQEPKNLQAFEARLRYPILATNKGLERFHDYSYVPGPDQLPPSQLVAEITRLSLERANKDILSTVCLIGASHTREMYADMMRNTEIRELSSQIKLLDSIRYFHGLSKATFEDCSIIVAECGQWPASERRYVSNDASYLAALDNKWGHPFGVSRYRDMMDKFLDFLENDPKVSHIERIFVLTTNINPPGEFLTSCPPTDGRLPFVIDAYNSALERLILERQVHSDQPQNIIEFVDTTDIMNPVWDIAEDWCHPSGLPLLAIGTRMLDRIRKYMAAELELP